MRRTVHRHLGKVVAGTAIAVAGTAVMVAVTLPGTAGADESGGTGKAAGSTQQQAADGLGAAPGVVQQAPAEGEKGKGRDPLTDDETKRVEQLAVNQQFLNSSENVDGKRGPQRLDVQLADPNPDELDNPNAPRRADVTFYDYKDDTVVTKTVNLDTGKVEQTGTQHGVQPPASHAEDVEAAELLLADPLGAGLKADYKDATGNELTSPDQLLLTAMIYKATPGRQSGVLDQCGEHRCVRLFPKVKNGPWIDARDFVIDLSARKVGKLTG
ncbi:MULTISPECIES: Tat pathway signal sequence domain protein [unclassified Streptomyces]|uniref:Tat pathway signal sequence domain protein n=1 Tax=unclassified Streptomyces TaxID=2593676 RepID=UPI00190B80F0|nr:Tat pathway signal sequence domain protein [Streptomyces sp. MBT65]MBK3575529.1 Tat pathway signal sequence domain protein [Streptomyces sp. MBT65]